MTEGFKQQIKQWVTLDNELRLLNERVKELRQERQEINTNIISYVNNHELNTSTIQLSDGCLKFTNNKTYTPLTFAFIEQCMKEIIPENTVHTIIQHIKDKRLSNPVLSIKRNID